MLCCHRIKHPPEYTQTDRGKQGGAANPYPDHIVMRQISHDLHGLSGGMGGSRDGMMVWENGFDDVRLVIGKEKENSRLFHSWVAWYAGGKVYILDPTADSEMWEIKKYPKGYYRPYYSFHRDKSWRHS